MSVEHAPTTGVIVTGAGSGIGRACVLALAAVGRPVAAWDLDATAVEEAVTEARDRFGVAGTALGIDVRETTRFPAAIDAARSALGAIGGLVHSAGVSHAVPLDDLDAQAWSAVLDVNLSAYAFLARALLADLRAHAGSAIVGIASINAILGNAANPAYGASKSGLLGLTRSLADLLAKDGVRVNAVCPGYVDTPMLAGAFAHAPALRAQMERQTMLERLADPEEIATVVRFLLSSDARYVTAEHIVVDGGATRSQR